MLAEIEPKFNTIMNDPSNFGMAKSFMMMGQQAGFDMTDQNQMNEFLLAYNENKIKAQSNIPPLRKTLNFIPEYSQSKKTKAKRKQKRIRDKASRKKDKKKRRR